MSTQRVTVGISSPSSTDSRDDGYVELEVRDETSGELLVRTQIPAGRWWRLCQGSVQHHDAMVSPHLDRVGKKLETTTVRFGREWTRDQQPEERDIYRAVSEQKPGWEDYQSASVRYDRDGWMAVVRRWVEPDDE